MFGVYSVVVEMDVGGWSVWWGGGGGGAVEVSLPVFLSGLSFVKVSRSTLTSWLSWEGRGAWWQL